MPRPLDWELRALAWFRALSGDQRLAVLRAIGDKSPEGAAFGRLVYECSELSEEETRRRSFEEEGKPAIREFFNWFVGNDKK